MTSRLCKAITSLNGSDATIWSILGELDDLTSAEKNDFGKKTEERGGPRLEGYVEGSRYEGWTYIPIKHYVHFAGLSGTGDGNIILHRLPAAGS